MTGVSEEAVGTAERGSGTVVRAAPTIARFEAAPPKRVVDGGTIQILADCVAADASTRLELSVSPTTYAIHPKSVPLNPGINLVRVRVVIVGPAGHVTVVAKLGDAICDDHLFVEAAPRSRR